MQFRPTVAALGGLLALAACTDHITPVAPGPDARAAVTQGAAGRYLVAFKNAAVPSDFAARIATLGGKVEVASAHGGFATVSGLSSAAAAKLAKAADIASVDVNARIPLDRPLSQRSRQRSTSSPVLQSPTDPTTALLFPYQWNLRAVHADDAWAAGFLGSPTVRVAILDSGIDYLNPDLAGLVDLAHSASFVPEDDALAATFFPDRNPVTDLEGHGTHIASIVSSNAFFVAGVTSRTTLMAVKVLGIAGGDFGTIAQGIVYAVDNGADVINMSLGAYFFKAQTRGAASFFNRLIGYAAHRGVTVVVSAGNEGIDLDHDGNGYDIWCNTPNVICVSATGPQSAGPDDLGPFLPTVDAFGVYSDYGRSAINVAAPGGNYVRSASGQITSAAFVWGACSTSMLQLDETTQTFEKGPCAEAWPNFLLFLGGIGTSDAAPHVSGLAALLVPLLGRDPAQIRARIQQTADDLGQPGTDPFYGKGRINVARALGL